MMHFASITQECSVTQCLTTISSLGEGCALQDLDYRLQVVPVNGADVVEAELLEQRRSAAADHAARILIDLCRRLLRS